MASNIEAIETTVDSIRETDLFTDFFDLHELILADEHLLSIIEAYRKSRELFAEARLNGYDKEQMDKAKATVREKQLAFEAEPILKDYFRKERFVELFLDDLQYEFNQLLSLQKSSCS